MMRRSFFGEPQGILWEGKVRIVMDQSAVQTDRTELIFGKWNFGETLDEDINWQKLMEERRRFEEERREFEQEKKAFSIHKSMEDRRIESERHLFEMKWKILEDEVKKLASERERVEKQRDFYKRVSSFDQTETVERSRVVHADMFFVGVKNGRSLKKRYKDLLKIYHPDNLSGDTGALQEINREYDILKQQYGVS